jgi:glycosyltransferase involved in cell wall biosynthesis
MLPPLEVVVVDQSCSSAARKVVSDCAEKTLLNLRYYHHTGCGHTAARNIGIRMSRGDIIAFTDDDCLADERWISAIIQEFRLTGANCVCGRTVAANHRERRGPAYLSTLRLDERRVINRICNPLFVGRGNNMAFRREDIVALGGFNERIGVGTSVYAGDDTDILYRLLKSGGTVAATPHAVIRHAQPDDWANVIRKKRGYAISFSAIFSGKAVNGDVYAGMLVTGKLLYEAVFLFGRGVLFMQKDVAQVGWHSMMGSLSGLKYIFDRGFTGEIGRLAAVARKSSLEDCAPAQVGELARHLQDRP